MRRLLLDTNAWADFARGSELVRAHVVAADRVLMSAVVVGELLTGFRHGRRTDENLERLEVFLSRPSVDFLPVSMSTCDRFGRVMAALRAAGTPIPTNDAWIAAHALETGAAVLTRDSHFDAVPGLIRVDSQPRPG